MGAFIRLAYVTELAEGAMNKYKVQDTEIMIARIDDKYYAVENKCPHFGGDLSRGKLEGTIVTCPRHGSRFNLIDGSVVRWMKGSGVISSLGKIIKSPRNLVTYNVKIEGQDIMVEVQD